MYSVINSKSADNQQVPANARSQSYWAGAISASWQKSVASIFETGNLLLQAREELDHDVFNAMKLPFKIRARQMLMRIAAHPVLANHGSQLPPCWRAHALLARKKDHGRAEAALLALYGFRNLRGNAAPPGAQPGSISQTISSKEQTNV